MMRPPHALRLASVATALALAGCALGPDYARPEARLGLPADYTAAAPTPAANAIAADWWTLFGDARLNELVGQALASSPDALSAAARMEEADAVLRQVDAALLPQINADASGSRSRISQTNATPIPSTAPITRSSTRLALSTAFELDVWGKLQRASEAARAQALGSRYAAETVYLSLAATVTQAYLNLRAIDAQLLAVGDSVSSQARSARLTRTRFEGGIASQLDVQQADGALATYTAAQVGLEKARALAENLLGLLVGQPGLKVAPGDLRSLPLPPVPPAGLPSALLEARPDVKKAETDLIAANAKIGVAKAALFPTITLTGSFGRESKDLSQLFSAPSAIWSLGAGITQPIFEGGRLRAQVEQVSAQQKQSLETYRKTVQGAFREVNDALVGVGKSAEAEDAYTRAMDAARRALHLAQARYDAGYSPYLEVLSAQRTANDATVAWVQNRQARLGATVDLFKALGGGWKKAQG